MCMCMCVCVYVCVCVCEYVYTRHVYMYVFGGYTSCRLDCPLLCKAFYAFVIAWNIGAEG